ncbi:adenylate/guanylate cyclase domain-containing protein [Aestuariivita sp.]|jgi:adenylate cyclase|uniref:adenylate/guanylate cyclase domain-containing protein n=1 Tax=Aestuariivita sp. TaxID=1872407 RepID=UPI00216FEEBC|nr:adenylate/guanylate cyclase domain-containing protein [Aestuariivita sp.]MCE8007745.1 adenylate/guanylate cyclase domain-containing protein [Aestuariivita sp.]
MSPLWRGSLATRLRIVSGLVLFGYALFHFLNIGMGLASPAAMEAMQEARQVVTRSGAGTVILYSALIIHAAMALVGLAQRGTLRMPLREAIQLGFGLTIPLFLITHIIFTRGAHEIFGVNDDYGYLIGLIWGSSSAWTQTALLLLVWIHGCIGLHIWLRAKAWWRAAQPWLIALAVLVPAFAMVGFVTEGRRITVAFADPDRVQGLLALYNWPDAPAFDAMVAWKDYGLQLFWLLLGLSMAAYALRWLMRRRQSVRISYVDGPGIAAPKGLTLLEMSQANGIPHTSLCGGKGRCTTCRVVIESGADHLHPPGPAEARSLAAVGARVGTRLACQIRPAGPLTVFRVFQPDGRRKRAHASQGEERRLAILFLDMRGFTARTTGQLPYDVVFLLNRFFDAIVPPITGAGGTVDKYLGDGLLAVFETADEASSARAGLKAVKGILSALLAFNETLEDEGSDPVRVGIGLHLGEIVLGEIGAGHAPRTIIGDAVNTASRLEAKTKELSVPLLITEALLAAAGLDPSDLPLVTLELRGVSAPVAALPVVDLAELDALPAP